MPRAERQFLGVGSVEAGKLDKVAQRSTPTQRSNKQINLIAIRFSF